MSHEYCQGLRRQSFNRFVVLGIQLTEEVIYEQRNVLAAIREWWQDDAHHVGPVKQILSKYAAPDLFGQRLVGRRNHAHVHLDGEWVGPKTCA